MPRLEDPLDIGRLTVPNRLYRAPLLECAGTGPDTVDTLIDELEPAAAAGVGLICQGATIVRENGGCAAPGMTRVADPAFVSSLSTLTDRIHDHGGTIVAQLEHGGIRSMETWHAEYRRSNPQLEQLAVSRPPWQLRVLDRLGLLSFTPRVLDTAAVYDLAADFGRCAASLVDAGYDGIHLAGANMGIIQQFLSPFYNRRDDEFGGTPEKRLRFLAVVYDEIRRRAGDIALLTKVPAETAAPAVIRRKLTIDDGVEIARRLERIGYDAVVPVQTSVTWDMSIVRGAYPKRAWENEALQEEYDAAFGGAWRRRLVATGNRLQARQYDFEPAWNESFCRRVRDAVSIPVLAEGGIRGRDEMNRLLGGDGDDDEDVDGTTSTPQACDAVGLARPFYAEPRLGARILDEPATRRRDDVNGFDDSDGEALQRSIDASPRVICESCNNCTVPQVTGAPGICRTPSVLRKRRQLIAAGAYENLDDGETHDQT